jgi:hypothetical protein
LHQTREKVGIRLVCEAAVNFYDVPFTHDGGGEAKLRSLLFDQLAQHAAQASRVCRRAGGHQHGRDQMRRLVLLQEINPRLSWHVDPAVLAIANGRLKFLGARQ